MKVVLVGEDGATKEGEKRAAPSASAGIVKRMPLLVMGGDGNLRQKVGEGARGGEQQGKPGRSRGAGAQSPARKSGGPRQTVLLVRGMSRAKTSDPQGVKQGQPRGTSASALRSSGAEGNRGKQVQNLARGGGDGRAGPKTEGQASGKGKTVTKHMPNGGRSGSPSQTAQRGAQSGGQGGTGTPSEAGPGRAGRTAGRQSATNGLNLDAQVRGEAGRSPEASSRRGADAASTNKGSPGKESAQGRAAALFSGKSRAADAGRGREAIREAPGEGRSARTTRDGQARGRQARGRAGQQGGQGHQKGGSHGQGAGQNGQGQSGQGRGTKNGPGFQALASSSTNTSGESDAQTLRASLTRDGASTGSGTQGTDGKSASTSGSNAHTATTQSTGRSGGKSAPPRTMPSAWLNAAKQGPLRTAELAGGWKALEMSLGEDKGTMTVKARQGQEQTAVSVGFSDTRVQAQVTANARQLQEALQSQYGTDVDLSFSGGDPNESDREAPDGTRADRASARMVGDDTADEEATGTASLRSRGRREWVG